MSTQFRWDILIMGELEFEFSNVLMINVRILMYHDLKH